MSAGSLAVDVAVVGGGGAGLAAALEAGRAGARVAILDKASEFGGATALSGGGCCIPGTPLQKKKSISDTADAAFEDWLACAAGEADAAWVRYYLDHALQELYFWLEQLGIDWVTLLPQEGNRVPRWHRPSNHGLGIAIALEQAMRTSAAHAFTSTKLKKLVVEDGAVRGLVATGADALEVAVSCKSLVMATGGFTSNLDMVLAMRPELKDCRILVGGGPGATGDAHGLLRDLGAELTHLDNIWFYVYATPDYRDPRGRRGLVFRHPTDYIWVNQQGRRFHDESLCGGASATPALLAQSPRHAWNLLDAETAATLEVADPYYRRGAQVNRDKVQELLEHSPFVRRADSLQALASAMEVDVPAFVATVERHNRACAEGLERDPDFGKALSKSKPLVTPPFYAMQIFPLARKNFGGVKTDLKCRVLGSGGAPIRGLYCAGELSGMAGGHINGRAALEGTMLGPSIFSGRVAGAWAAQEAGFGRGFAPAH